MGFNVSVWAKNAVYDESSYFFIDRAYYNFVVSFDNYGEDSVVIKTGEYFGLDLHPLTKLVYLDATGEEEETETVALIAEAEQDVEALLALVSTLRDKVALEPAAIDKISYRAYEEPLNFDDVGLDEMDDTSRVLMSQLLEEMALQQERQKDDPNPWKEYFHTGRIVEDLNSVIEALTYFRNAGFSKVYFEVG